MSISRRHALDVIEGYTHRINEHLAKMRADRFALDYNHWRTEVENWMRRVESLARHVGKRTSLEILSRVEQWKKDIVG